MSILSLPPHHQAILKAASLAAAAPLLSTLALAPAAPANAATAVPQGANRRAVAVLTPTKARADTRIHTHR